MLFSKDLTAIKIACGSSPCLKTGASTAKHSGEGRKVAKSLGLNVTGILGVLLRAKQAGELESLQLIIDDLVNKAGFRIAPELLTQILI